MIEVIFYKVRTARINNNMFVSFFTNQGFVLYGGTAIALRLAHRPSVDFDFFND